MRNSLPVPGELFEGKYKIVGIIGEGKWGQVLEGVNVRLQRKVAIKILRSQYASNAEMVTRFEQEARASIPIESPHVVHVYDAGVLADGRPYLVMELLSGDDLGTRITLGGRLPILVAVEFCVQIARGLAAAHAAGVFHRDVKPNNIVITRTRSGRDVAKLVDFGISKLVHGAGDSPSMTQTGTVLGSPAYMSPEQARGSSETDHRADIYSLGVVLFECLTGTTPHHSDSLNELLFKVVLDPTPSVRSHRPQVDVELDEILARTLAKSPVDRVQTATELEALLVDWLARNGGSVVEESPASGPRLLADLTSTLTEGADAVSSSQLVAARRLGDDRGGPPPSSPGARAATGAAESAPPQGADSAHRDSSPAPSPSSRAPVAPPESRRTYTIASLVALAALVAIAAAVLSRGRPADAATPSALATDLRESPATATTPAMAPVRASTPPEAPSSAAVGAAPPPPGVRGEIARPRAVDAAAGGVEAGTVALRAKPTASASASPPASATASSASVAGRKIRTDL